MPERSWKLALRGDERWQRRLEDPTAPLEPVEKLRATVDVGFKVSLQGVVTRAFERKIELRRYAKDQREALEAAGHTWEEPSAHLDQIVADFRYELEIALKDAMPWDDEL